MELQEFKHFPAISPNGNSFITVVSGPVIIHDNKVFLVKHGKDEFWKFPGGSMKIGGTFEETALREAREELGVDVELVSEPAFFVFDRSYQGTKEYVVLCHYAARFEGVIECAQDIKEGAWHSVDALPKDCAPNVPAMVKHFLHPKNIHPKK